MIPRSIKVARVLRLLREFPVVGLLGARQTGKTTLARMVEKEYGRTVHAFDLENPVDRHRLSDPMLALTALRGLVVLDEIQCYPDLFPVLRVLSDRKPRRARFLVLGSASPEMLRQTSETLAGRIAFEELSGFDLGEVGVRALSRLWFRGGLPLSYLARSDAACLRWLTSYARTFLERDLPQLGVRVEASTMERFWSMLAHYHGQTWNSSELARAFGVSDTTVRRYLDLLTSTFMVRQLQPWSANLAKRQVKAPKVYLRDSGLLHHLLGIRSSRELEGHPKRGASWESLVIETTIACLQAEARECHYWATHAGAELDLLVVRGKQKVAVEAKYTSAPTLTKSMRIAMEDLELQRLLVVHAGDHRFPLTKSIEAVPLAELPTVLKAP